MMRAVVIDGRGHKRGVWGTSIVHVGKEQPIDPAVEQSIINECQKYLDRQWRDADTVKLGREMRQDEALRFVWFRRILNWRPRLPRRWAWVLLFVLAVVLAYGMVYSPDVVIQLGVTTVFGIFYALLLGTIVMSGISRDSRRREWPTVPMWVRVRAIVQHGHCADCGYSIKDIPAEPDGCRICPECGAAWKLPRHPQVSST